MTPSNHTRHLGLSQLLAFNFALAILLSVGTSHADDTQKKVKAPEKELYKQIEAAVLAGKITKEQARAKLQALKEHGVSKDGLSKDGASKENADKVDDDKTVAHVARIWTELQSLVAAGKISQDEANGVIKTVKSSVLAGGSPKKTVDAKPTKDFYKQIEAAVAAGKITKKEAQAKLKALQQQDLPKKILKESDAKKPSKAALGEHATGAYLKSAWAELQEAVAAGKLTKEQAVAKMTAIKKAELGEK